MMKRKFKLEEELIRDGFDYHPRCNFVPQLMDHYQSYKDGWFNETYLRFYENIFLRQEDSEDTG